MPQTQSSTHRSSRLRRVPLFVFALVMLLVGVAGALWLIGGGGGGAPAVGGPFALENGQGQPVTDRTFRGKYMLVYFGYTFCPDVCPTTLNQVAGALKQLGAKADRVQALFITVDPKRDTPEVVGQYAAAFGPRIEGLTGTPEQIAQVAREYRVYYQEHRTGPGPNDYTMDHSSILYLMGPQGGFIAPIRTDESAAEMAADLSSHIS
jgi:protein SCO1